LGGTCPICSGRIGIIPPALWSPRMNIVYVMFGISMLSVFHGNSPV
jgi:hypothetical protein